MASLHKLLRPALYRNVSTRADPYSALFEGMPASGHPTIAPSPRPSKERSSPRPASLTAAEAAQFESAIRGLLPTYSSDYSTGRMHEHFDDFDTSTSSKSPANPAKLHQLENWFRTTQHNKKAVAAISKVRGEIAFAAQNYELDAFNEELASLETDQQLWSWFHHKIVHPGGNKFIASPNYPKVVNLVFERLMPNPHLALALFHLVSTISPASFVAGITADLYLNLCRLKWTIWFDVQGVEEAVTAMVSSGITVDWPIRTLVSQIRTALDADSNKARTELQTYLHSLSDGKIEEDEQAEIDRRCRFSRSDRRALGKLEQLIAEQPYDDFLHGKTSFDDYNRLHRPRSSYSGPNYSSTSLQRPTNTARQVEEFDGPLWESSSSRSRRQPLDDVVDEMERSPPRFSSFRSDHQYQRTRGRNPNFPSTSSVGLRAFSTCSFIRGGRQFGDRGRGRGDEGEEERKPDSEWGFERPSWAGSEVRRNKYLEADQERGSARQLRGRDNQSESDGGRRRTRPVEVMDDGGPRRQAPAPSAVMDRQLSPAEKAKEDAIWASYTTTSAAAPQDDEANEVWDKFAREHEGPNAQYRKPLWPGALKALERAEPLSTPMGSVYKKARKNLTAKEKARFDEPHPMLAWKKPFDKAALKKKLAKSGRAPVFRKESKGIWDNY